MTIPYYGPWKIVGEDGEIQTNFESQTDAISYAQSHALPGSIVCINAAECVIEIKSVTSSNETD
jgi:hypothetical protein